MADFIKLQSLRELQHGLQVTYDPGTLAQTGSQAIFAISGGRIAISALTGVVTTAIQNQTCTISLGLSPSTGTASGTNLGGTIAITNLEKGSQVGLPLTQGGLTVATANAGTPLLQSGTPFICNSGTIYATTSASNTGDIAWQMLYVPIDTGAAVAAG